MGRVYPAPLQAGSTTPAAGATPVAGSDGTLASGWVSSDLKIAKRYSRYCTIAPYGTLVLMDGIGSISSAGLDSTNRSDSKGARCRVGDSSAATSRVYVTHNVRREEGVSQFDMAFQLGSDISGSTQQYFFGYSSTVSLATTDPSGNRAMLMFASGGTNWLLTTKDGTTAVTADTGVVVTASYYYVMRLYMSTAGVSAKIGRGVSLEAAIANFLTATTTAAVSNLPTGNSDLFVVTSLQRLAASTSRYFEFFQITHTCEPTPWA